MARHGENIRKRADGRWEGRYKIFDEKKEKNVYRSVYGHTYHEVKEKLTTQKNLLLKKEEDHYHDVTLDCKILFSKAAGEWLEDVKKKNKYSTYVKYKGIYRLHIDDVLGSYKISEINNVVDSLKMFEDLSISMQKSVCCVVNQILRYINERYRIHVYLLKKPVIKTEKKAVETLSNSEQSKLFSSLYDSVDRYKISIILCMYTGLRLGELCALKWNDIDVKNLTISVNRTVQRIVSENKSQKSILIETPPKSDSSKRIIPVSSEIMELLLKLYSNHPYVFGKEKPLEPRTMQYRFKKILEKAGIENRNFHTLRHTFATNCIENNMDVKTLSEILGHSNVKITLNCYVHPTMDSKREQIEKLSGFYGQICGHVA